MYDTFNTLNEQYSDDEFGTKYSELNLQQTFTTLGVTPFNVVPGDKINNFRMKVLESENSTEQPKDTILREVASGLELSGNVIRPASCISSNGSGEDKNENNNDDEATDGGESE
jgi:molecular chaperone GrpE (heat shock protein)